MLRKIRKIDFLPEFFMWLYFGIIFIILALIFFLGDRTEFYAKRELLLSHKMMVVISAIVTVLICFFNKLLLKKERASEGSEEPLQDGCLGSLKNHRSFLEKWEKPILVLILGLLFIAQLVLVNSAFFFSDWDPSGILSAAHEIANGRHEEVSIDYFSAHPNNLVIVWIYAGILRLYGIFHQIGYYGSPSVMWIVYLQCLLFTISGYLVYRISRDLTNSVGIGFFTLLYYVMFIGLSPWIIITYSDAAGLIFPLLILRLYQRDKNGTIEIDGRAPLGQKRICNWCLIGFLSRFGYAIKPQILIVFIAVLIIEILGLREIRSSLKEKLIGSALGILIGSLLISVFIIPSTGLKLQKSKAFGMAHYLMMGLNQKTDGVYDNDDTNFTNSIEDPAERRRTNLQVAAERAQEFGLLGLCRHLYRKTLVNFCDGTFAFGINGNFFAGELSGKENRLTPFLRSVIYTDGENFRLYATIMGILWYTILLSSLLPALMIFHKDLKNEMTAEANSRERQRAMIHGVICLSLIGIFVFEILFEALARYLFIYSPVWLLAASSGWRKAASFLNLRLSAIESPLGVSQDKLQ